jgi:subtilisin family serine protease
LPGRVVLVVVNLVCLPRRWCCPPSFRGHATHVAGTIGAIDNERGVVGVAPGARIWGVDVFDQEGFTTLEALLCAADWVIAHADTIEVVNMSASF